MPTKINVTELNFDQIKANLIDYFKNSDTPFADWDYTGSALNTVIDVLANNTHYNAILAHMAVNESFIDSAQLRANVVSAAKLLGYIPRSAASASAEVDIRIVNPGEIGSGFTLDRETKFLAQAGGRAYVFIIDDDFELFSDGNGGFINDPDIPLVIRQGARVTRRYQVNAVNNAEKYVIDDENIDIGSLKVRVYANAGDTAGVLFSTFRENNINIDGTSPIYFINENSLGKYELQFGNGIFGVDLKPNSIIETEYVMTDGADANGIATGFSLIATGQGFTSTTLVPRTTTRGGRPRESTERIRQNSPAAFITQDRAVTADDYKSIILQNFTEIESVSVWGGEDNRPPQYGKAFITVKQRDSVEPISALTRKSILDVITPKKVLSITPEIIDPEYVSIVLDVMFKYNKNILSGTKGALESEIMSNVIGGYNGDNLNSFNSMFRYSELSRLIDTYSPAILNNHLRIFLSKNIVVDKFGPQQTIKYGAACTVDDGTAIGGLSFSTPWYLDGRRLAVADESTLNQNIRNFYTYYRDEAGERIRVEEIGTLNMSTGTLTIKSNLTIDEPATFNLQLIPNSNDIVPARNQLLSIDSSRSTVRGFIDELAVGGSSRAINYVTFKRDR